MLIATMLLDFFWMRSWKPFARWSALALFVFSPCLLLYGRMARSYSMQLALSLLAVSVLWLWMQKPHSKTLGCAGVAAILALLYTHYVPGFAIFGAFVLTSWRALGLLKLGTFSAAVVLGYFPWIAALVQAIQRWAAVTTGSLYSLSGNLILEHVLKICYGLVSLTIGETFAMVSLLLSPLLLWLAIRGIRACASPQQLFVWLAIAAIIGYLAVAHFDSYPFIPARLLWLIPFGTLAVAVGISQLRSRALRYGIGIILLLSYFTSDVLYFRRENFLNPGYNAPLPEIAEKLNQDVRPGDLILTDAYNTDAYPLALYLNRAISYIVLEGPRIQAVRRQLPSAKTVWIVRNTRDISPERITTEIQSEACTGRLEQDSFFEPYAPWQQAAMKIAGLQPVTHFYQLTRCTVL